MKQKLLFPFLILCCLHAFGQKEYNVWYFGNKAGITFNTNPPSALLDGKLSSYESSSGICDEHGNLMFYTNGDTVWNKNHLYMKGGMAPIYYNHMSSIQGSIVIKKPDSKSQYYIFCSASQESVSLGVNTHVRYWLIDMDLDNGLGEVIAVNYTLLPGAIENLGITWHSNGSDFWIGAMEKSQKKFNCIQTLNGGFSNSIVSSVIDDAMGAGSVKFSPNSSILYCSRKYISSTSYGMDLYRFNNTNGVLADKLEINTVSLSYYIEFSHDSRFLYVIYAGFKRIDQYDLSLWNKDSIEKSVVTIDAGSIDRKTGLQLGPDRKIYVFIEDQSYISVIDSPWLKGIDCHYSHNVISLSSRLNRGGGPYYPNCIFKRPYISWNNKLILCENDSTVLDGRVIKTMAKVIWNTGDTSKTIISKQPGWYWRMATFDGDTVIDSIEVRVGEKPIVYLGNDTAFCGLFSHALDVGKGMKEYMWSNGDTSYAILVNSPGVYSVTIKDSNSCASADTILLDQLLPPKVVVTDTLDCKHKLIRATPKDSGVHYLWSTGDTTEYILTDKEEVFSFVASNTFCSIKQSIDITNGCDMVYFIPNAFTPSGDGLNDIFKVTGKNIDMVHMQIYDRWGQKLFDETGANVFWDGKLSGRLCQQDVYVYSIILTGRIGGVISDIQYSGNISLLR